MGACLQARNSKEYRFTKHRSNCIRTKIYSKTFDLNVVPLFWTLKHETAFIEICDQYLSYSSSSISSAIHIMSVLRPFIINNAQCYIRERLSHDSHLFCMCWLLNDVTGDRRYERRIAGQRASREPANRMDIVIVGHPRTSMPFVQMTQNINDSMEELIQYECGSKRDELRHILIGDQEIEFYLWRNVSNGTYFNKYQILDRWFYKIIVLCFDIQFRTEYEYCQWLHMQIMDNCETQPLAFVLCGFGIERLSNDENDGIGNDCNASVCGPRNVLSSEAVKYAKSFDIPYLEIPHRMAHEEHSNYSNDTYAQLNYCLLQQCVFQFWITQRSCEDDKFICPALI